MIFTEHLDTVWGTNTVNAILISNGEWKYIATFDYQENSNEGKLKEIFAKKQAWKEKLAKLYNASIAKFMQQDWDYDCNDLCESV